jgi:hypothetical protein
MNFLQNKKKFYKRLPLNGAADSFHILQSILIRAGGRISLISVKCLVLKSTPGACITMPLIHDAKALHGNE